MLHSPGNSEDPRFTKKPRRRDDTPVIPDNSFPSLHSLPSPLPPATTDDVRSAPQNQSPVPTDTPTDPPVTSSELRHESPPEPYGPWMVVEKTTRRTNKQVKQAASSNPDSGFLSSQFNHISNSTDESSIDAPQVQPPYVASASAPLPSNAHVTEKIPHNDHSGKSKTTVKHSAPTRKSHGLSLSSSGLPISPPQLARPDTSRTSHTLRNKGIGTLLDLSKHSTVSMVADANPMLPHNTLELIPSPQNTSMPSGSGVMVKSISPQSIKTILRRPPTPVPHTGSPQILDSGLTAYHVDDRVDMVD
ncbi:hypothetical protein V6N13_015975 [Hibiscus sabdariffa]